MPELTGIFQRTSKAVNKMQNEFTKYPIGGALVLEDHSPGDVARAMIEGGHQKEPFHIFDTDEAYRRIQHFKDMMPRVKIFYAMKANDCEMMLKLAVSQGLGFDCASPGEIRKLIQLNVCPLSIIYAMTTKTPEQMVFARKSGVKHTTFDTPYELKKLKHYWSDASLLIRIRVDGDSLYKLGEKFGCDFETEATDLLDEAAALGLNVVGVAFHVGSACFSMESYEVGLRRVRALFDYETRAGRGMKIVDIGGGFLSDSTERIDLVSEMINNTLEMLFPDPEVQVVAEPGRYICDSSTTLYCNINNVRRVIKNGKPLNMIYINDGIFGTLRCSEPWHTVQRFKWTAEKIEAEIEDAILFGPSCDSDDRVMRDHTIRLPRITPFDWLVFETQGAYTFGFSSRFSCLEIPLLRQVISVELWNKIKSSSVFNSSYFKWKADVSAPLPSTLPALQTPSKGLIYENSQTVTLII